MIAIWREDGKRWQQFEGVKADISWQMQFSADTKYCRHLNKILLSKSSSIVQIKDIIMRSIRCDTAQGKQMWILERKFRVITSLSGFSRKAMYLHGTSVEAQLFPWQINTHASNLGVGNGVRNVSIASGQLFKRSRPTRISDWAVPATDLACQRIPETSE